MKAREPSLARVCYGRAVRRVHMGLLLAVAWVLAACQSRQAREVCRSKAETLGEHLAAIDLNRAGALGLHVLETPEATWSRTGFEHGPFLELSSGEALFEGHRLANGLGQFEAELELHARNLAILHPAEPPTSFVVYVIGPSELSAREVLPWLSHLPPGFQARLVVRRATTPKTTRNRLPSDWAVRSERLRALPKARREQELTRLLGGNVGRCQGLVDTWSRVRDAASDEKISLLQREVAPALIACDCAGVDVDGLAAALLFSFTPQGPPVGWLPLRVAPEHESDRRLELRSDSTMGDLVRELAAEERGGRRVWLMPRSEREAGAKTRTDFTF